MTIKKQIEISVVIPCYNEEANLRNKVLDQVVGYLNYKEFTWEVIIVDDGSTDNSYELCKQFTEQQERFRIFRIPHGGKPNAIYYGLLQATGKLVLFTDMDQSTPISELDKLLSWINDKYDVVIGSRGVHRSGFSFIRQITSWGFREFRRLFLLSEIIDTQCGFKLLKVEVAREIFPMLSFMNSGKESSGWVVSAFDVELLFIAKTFGYKIKEVDVKWSHKDQSETKDENRNRYYAESINMGKEVLNILKNNLQGRYKKKN